MKVSPNGRKLGFVINNPNPLVLGFSLIELYDFDSSTGAVSNPITLTGPTGPYGVEFSPDCTKLYVTGNSWTGNSQLAQWDLSAGSQPLIAASISTFAAVYGNGSMQLAPDGKIYVAKANKQMLGVVNNPNIGGPGCNYVDAGQSIGSKSSYYGLPNFITTGFKAPPPPFTSTINCSSANFSVANSTFFPAVTYSVTNVLWNFGDPASGNANTSVLNTPTHNYSTAGTYTTTLILYYNCSSDTVRQTLTVASITPTLNVAGNFTICESETHTYTVTGANSYTWSTGAQTSTLFIGPAASTATYNVVGTATNGCFSNKTFTVTVNKIPNLSFSGALSVCSGAQHIYTVSGASSYSWSTGATTSTFSIGPAASSATYHVVGTNIGGCSSDTTFVVTVNTTPSLSISGAFSVCSGEKRVYTASGASSYSWSTGSTTPSITVITSNSFMYTVVGTGTNGCVSQQTLAVTVNKCTGISEAKALSQLVRLYPNPVTTYLQLETIEKVEIILFDLQGRLVLKKDYEPGHHLLDLSTLQNGVYSIQTITAGESGSRKLVKLSD